jgi:hypothetical protein
MIARTRRPSTVRRRRSLRPHAVGPRAIGPTAIAPVAIGVYAVGALAVRRVLIVDAVIRPLHAGHVEITSLKVGDLESPGARGLSWSKHMSESLSKPLAERWSVAQTDASDAAPEFLTRNQATNEGSTTNGTYRRNRVHLARRGD